MKTYIKSVAIMPQIFMKSTSVLLDGKQDKNILSAIKATLCVSTTRYSIKEERRCNVRIFYICSC